MEFYSQSGEDIIAYELLKNISSGFYIEVGALDGSRFSNTKAFDKHGWKGICIEAHPDYIDILIKNRPDSIVIQCAVGENNEDDAIFYTNKRGALSSLSRHREKEFRTCYGPFFTGYEEIRVKKRSLNSILEEHKVKSIDLLSIDVEGTERQVIEGLDLKIYKPTVMIIESSSNFTPLNMDSILIPHGYHRVGIKGPNVIYANGIDVSQYIGRKLTAMLHHTPHPEDKDEYKVKECIIVI